MYEEDEATQGQVSEDISGHCSQFSLMKFKVGLLNFLESLALKFEDGQFVCI